jgi:hypothetical protein
MKQESIRTTVDIPAPLCRKLKEQAAARGYSIRELVLAGVKSALLQGQRPRAWTSNSDGRQAIFIRERNHEGYSATFIDHGYCFNAGEWSFVDSPMRGIYPNQRVYAGVSGWDSFEPALGRAERTERSDLAKCADQIPEEWCGDSAALQNLVDSLFRRRGMIRQLIDELRCSSRNPFPNWTEPTLAL